MRPSQGRSSSALGTLRRPNQSAERCRGPNTSETSVRPLERHLHLNLKAYRIDCHKYGARICPQRQERRSGRRRNPRPLGNCSESLICHRRMVPMRKRAQMRVELRLRRGPKVFHSGPMYVEFGRRGPNLVEFGPNGFRAKLGPIPDRDTLGQVVRAEFDRCRGQIGRSQPEPGQTWSNSARHRSK